MRRASTAVLLTLTGLVLIGVMSIGGTAPAASSEQGKRVGRQQPLVSALKHECDVAECLSLSTAVQVSDACWRACTVHCGGRFQACLGAARLNDCLAGQDHCDVACQAQCRVYGGPLLNLAD